MSEKDSSTSLALSEFFRTGKMDNDFIVQDKFVTGICLMYPERSAQEHEYMIREKSIVELDSRGLSACVQEAKDLACQAAMLHLRAGAVIPFPTPAAVPAQAAPAKKAPKQTPEASESTAPQAGKEPTAPKKIEAAPTEDGSADKQFTPVQEKQTAAPLPEDRSRDDLSASEYADDERAGDAIRVDLSDLRPASSLLPQEPAEEQQVGADSGEDEEAKQYETARNTVITVCGKLHDCYQWTAGKILDEKPQYIVELSQRYDGPRTEEKSALRALYHEALRRCNAAA